jgi:hypothetical protein
VIALASMSAHARCFVVRPIAAPPELSRRGRNPIRRGAIAPDSGHDGAASDTLASRVSDLSIAARLGMSVKTTAACQGSRSRRAKVETTLRGSSDTPSSIEANKNGLNSAPREVADGEFARSTTRRGSFHTDFVNRQPSLHHRRYREPNNHNLHYAAEFAALSPGKHVGPVFIGRVPMRRLPTMKDRPGTAGSADQ